MNYFNLLAIKVNQEPNKTFLVIDGQSYTYHEVYEACQVIEQCQEYDLQGQSVFIQSPNIYQQILWFFVISKQGGVPIIIHDGISNDLVRQLSDENKVSFIVSDRLSQSITSMRLLRLGEYQVQEEGNKRCIGVLSSGTTGIPKVMYRSFESWFDFFPTQNEIFKIRESDSLFMQGSLSFTANLNVLLAGLFARATIIIESYLSPKRWQQLLEFFNVTVIYLVPSKLELLLRHQVKVNEKVMSIFTGSQLLVESVSTQLRKQFPQALIQLYYGASEVSYVTYLRLEELIDHPLRVGKPFPEVSLSFDEDDIYIETPYTIEGISDPYHVGDKGYLDSEGYLVLTGRSDSVINVAGVKVSLLKIENELRKIVGIDDAVVCSNSHPVKGEEIIAYVVASQEIKVDAIISYLTQTLPPFERPNKIKIISRIPRNNMGKVERDQLIGFDY